MSECQVERGVLQQVGGGGGKMYHTGKFLSRTLERQMILNWNFLTFNVFLWWIKRWKSFFEKICQLSIFMYSFCVVNFIGNYVKVSLLVSFKHNF